MRRAKEVRLTQRRLLPLLALFALACAPLAAQEHGTAPPPADAHATPAPGKSADPHAQPHEKPSVFAGGLGNAVITLIIFGIVVYVLGRSAWPKVLAVLNEREMLIHQSLAKARLEREAAEKLLAEYKAQIEKARIEATAIVDEGRRDAESVRRRNIDETRKEQDEMIARAKREIQLATDAATKELYDRTAELAVQVAGGIIRKELNASDHRGLVDESLQRMKTARN